MSPLDMCLLASVAFAVIKVVQLWIVWELKRGEN
jgi:hypothetical protein